MLFPMVLAAVFGVYLYSSVGSGSLNTCMRIVPDNATVTFTSNSTFTGSVVSFVNGTNSFYLAGACPQPVHLSLYDAVSTVNQDPRFVRAENGSQFIVDPTNSLSSPVQAPNGSVYEVLLFDHLNLSDPIFPCDLNFVYSNPIAQIYVFIPVLPNGTYVYDNDAIVALSGKEIQFNCPQETGLTTFVKSQIPKQFQVGGFSFNLVSNETDFVGNNGTSYPGYDYAFNVTYVSGNVTQLVVFTWPSAQTLSTNSLPSPFISTPYDAYVVMRWFTNSTGLYLIVTTRA